jgi:GH24 family phage-related lysozyme (muramidase)
MMMGKQVRENAQQNSPPTSTNCQLGSRPFASLEHEHESLDREARLGYCFGEIDMFPIQPKQAGGQIPQLDSDLETQVHSMRNDGQPLPESTRAFFEPRFSYDFSQVRVHTGPNATKLAQITNARAFTVGQDILFGAGQYVPELNFGKRLIAHEIVHVVQQSSMSASNVSSAATIQRLEEEVTQTTITPEYARNLSNEELQEQIRIVQEQIYIEEFETEEQLESIRSNLRILQEEADARGLEDVAPAEVLATDTLMHFIEPWEGRRHIRYFDARGIATIGVGFNLERAGARARIGADYERVLAGELALNDEQIDALFRDDAEDALNSARRIVHNFDELPQEAQLIVADMVFNLGAAGFAGFRNTIAALENRDFARAADEMEDSLWYRQGARRPPHHVEAMRRLANH